MKRRIILKIIAHAPFLLFFACKGDPGEDGKDGEGDGTKPKNRNRLITGLCQKGPCFEGGKVEMYPIDPGTINQNGEHFFGKTTDDFGAFEVPGEISEDIQYIEVTFEGTCHNELTYSEDSQELDAIVNVDDAIKNINPLTTIRTPVARDLFSQGFGTVGECLDEAERLILAYLDMQTLIRKFTEMNLETSGIHDAVLCLTNSMILWEKTPAEQLACISNISQGVINNDLTLKAEIAGIYELLPLIRIKDNLKARYLELGLEINVPKIWNLSYSNLVPRYPSYYSDILERDPVVQISHNMDLNRNGSFDQTTYNTFAIPIVFPDEILTSNYIAFNFPPDSQVSIWTKSNDAYPVPLSKRQDITALKEIMIKPLMRYNGMLDADNMPVPGVEYYLVIRKDTDFVLSKNSEGSALPFGQVLASDDEMITWIGKNTTDFFTRDIKYFTIN
jgi:hypothetical protein